MERERIAVYALGLSRYLCNMLREGNANEWEAFHVLIGRYAVSAANAESYMYRLLLELERRAEKPRRTSAPGWNKLVSALRSVAKLGQHEERVTQVLRKAERRAKARNDLVHTAWFAVSLDAYLGRRHYSHDEGGSAVIRNSHAALKDELGSMERFEAELEGMAFELMSSAR